MRTHPARVAIGGLALLTMVQAAVAHQLLVGRNSQNQIVLILDDGPTYDLPLSSLPGFPGFADAEPGFVGNGDDMPADDFFSLPIAADLEFQLVSAQPHIQVWNDTGTAPMTPGQVYHLGMGQFHNHPVWHSPDGTPNEVYSLTIQVRDRTGLLSNSANSTIGFRPVPEPATVGLLVRGAAILARRR